MSGLKAVPAKYFAVGPYRAERIHGSVWGVFSKNGVNVLTFPHKPGAVLTDEADAKRIADEWNARTEPFEYAPDPYTPPKTQRWTEEQMSAYIRNRRYNWETKRWS
jgi:hypothetical protein